MPMQRVVVFAVFKLVVDALANFKSEIARYRNVTLIKQWMNITSKKDSISRFVTTSIRIRSDVCSFQCR